MALTKTATETLTVTLISSENDGLQLSHFIDLQKDSSLYGILKKGDFHYICNYSLQSRAVTGVVTVVLCS